MTKAISAIIATIMLLMITVSLIGVFYVFSSTLTSSATSSGGEQVSQLTSQFMMCIKIDNIYVNQVTLRNCGKGVIENKSLVVMMDDVKLGASANTINEGESGIVNVSGLWQIPPGKHNLKISNGAAFAQALVDVQPNKDGLVGSWSFNEGGGTIANDGSGNGNVGTLTNGPTWTAGKFGGALQFDGVNDYVSIGGFGNKMPTSEITIEAWINPATAAGQHDGFTFVPLEPQASSRVTVHFPWDGNIIWQFGKPFVSLSATFQSSWAGVWGHYVFQASSSGNYMKIYRNGVQIATTGSMSNFTQVAADWVIGGRTTNPFNGTIDGIHIWNRALAPDETAGMKQII